MVSVFVGSGAGFARGSGATLGSAGILGSGVQGRGGEAVSVNAATGNLLISQQDDFLIGRGPDSAVSRTYNSLAQVSDDNGDHWRFGSQRRLTNWTGTPNTAGASVDRVGEDGSVVTYTYDAGLGYYRTTEGAGAHDRIVNVGHWVWTDGDTQTQESYDVEGTLLGITDTDGNSVSFTYHAHGSGWRLSRATTSNGEYQDYVWSGENVSQIVTGYTDLATNTPKTLTRTRYSYDAQNRLAQVTVDLSPEDNSIDDGRTYVTTYSYDGSSRRVAGIAQTDGSSLAIAYDGMGRVATLTQTVAVGDTRVTSLSYGPNHTDITGPDGQVTRLDYDGANQLTKITAPPASPGALPLTLQFGYDAAGNLTSATDIAGKVTNYSYDASGNQLTATDANGNTVTRAYGAKNELLAETRTGSDASGAAVAHTTRYVYDSGNRLRYLVSAEGRVTEYHYHATGEISTITEYPEHGYPVGPGALSEAAMNAWRDGIADKQGLRHSYMVYDARGNVTEKISYGSMSASGAALTSEGYTHSFWTYDQAGRLLSRHTAPQNSETFLYDGLGRLVGSTDLAGGTTTILFNDAALTTTVTIASGATTVQSYNKAGDLVGIVSAGDGSPSATSTFLYDKLGRLRVETDPLGFKVHHLYDAAGRKTAEIDHYGQFVEYRYDAAGRLAATIRYFDHVTPAHLAQLANPDNSLTVADIRPSDAATIWAWRVYDDAGRLVEEIDGDGRVVQHGYDASDRLVSTRRYVNQLSAAQIASFKSAAPTAVVTPAAHAGDVVTRNFYDRDGLLIGSLDGEGYLTEVVYDKAGQRVEEIGYAAQTSSAYWGAGTFDELRSTAAPASGANRRNRFVYDGQGLLRFGIDNAGRVTEYVYASDVPWGAIGPVRSTIRHAVTIATSHGDFTYDHVKALVAANASNAANRTSWSVYDAAGRLAYAIEADGAVTAFTYDAMGNLTKSVAFAARRATSALPTEAMMNSWRDANIDGGADRVVRNWYSQRGDLRFTVDAEGFVTEHHYDAEGKKLDTIRYDTAVSVGDGAALAGLAAAIAADYSAGHYQLTRVEYDGHDRVEYAYDALGIQTRNWRAPNGLYTSVEVAVGTADASSRSYGYRNQARQLAWEGVAWGQAEAIERSYFYDGLGNLTSERDPRSNTTSYTYDRRGLVLTKTDAAGGVTRYEYNAFGEVVKTTDPAGFATTRYYDELGRVTRVLDAENYVTGTSYTVFDEVASVTRYYNPVAPTGSTAVPPALSLDPGKDATTLFEYDRRGRVTRTTDAEGWFESYGYDAFGNRTSVTAKSKDAAKVAGGTTIYAYDRRGLLVRATRPVAAYDNGGNPLLSSVTGGYDVSTTYAYDARGNRIRMVEAAGLPEARATDYVYDRADRLIETRMKVIRVVPATGLNVVETRVDKLAYDARGNVTSRTDGAGARTVYYYDDLDRVVVTIDAVGTYTAHVYDANGNVTATTIYGTPVAIPADGGAKEEAPAPPGGDSRTTSFTYDNLNRLLTSRVAGVTSYVFNGTGLVPQTDSVQTLFEYDANGNVIKTTDANGHATYNYYDRLGNKTAQLDSEQYLTRWTYDAEGNVLTETRYARSEGNGPTETRYIRSANRLSNADFAGTDGWYAWNPHGIATGAPFAGPWYGQDGIKLQVNATTWDQTVSLAGDPARDMPVTGGERLEIDVGIEAAGSIGKVDLVVHFYDAGGALVTSSTVGVLHGNQPFGTRLSGFLDAPAGAVTMRLEVYGNSWGAGPGHLVLLEPAVYAVSAPPSAYEAVDRVTSFTYDRNGNRLTETRAGVGVHDGSGGVTAPQAVTVSWLYNGLGQVVQKNEATDDPARMRGEIGDESTYYAYDAGGRLIREERAAFTDHQGAIVRPTVDYAYNGLDDLARTVAAGAGDAAARVTRYQYGTGGVLEWVQDSAGQTVYHYQDIAGRSPSTLTIHQRSDGTMLASREFRLEDFLGRVTETRSYYYDYTSGTGWDWGVGYETRYTAYGEVERTLVQGATSGENRYDGAGRLIATTAGDGLWKHFGYDANGNQTIAITSAGASLAGLTFAQALALVGQEDVNATYTVYDKRGQAVRVIEEQRRLSVGATQDLTSTRRYNAFGELASETDASGATTNYVYNAMGRLIRSEGPTASITLENGGVQWVRAAQDYYYDASGRLVATRDANGSYDGSGTKAWHTGNLTRLTLLAGTGYGGGASGEGALVTQRIAADGGTQQTRYDIHGDARTLIDALGRTTTQRFDGMGRVTEVSHAGGLVDAYAYDGLGRRVRHWNNLLNPGNVTDGLTGEVETIDYDTQGRVMRTRAFGGDVTTTRYSWDASIAAAGAGTTAGGWSQVTVMANGRTLTEKTDLFGRATWKQDLGGHVTGYGYDLAGRQTASTMDGLTATFTWYNGGQIATNSGPNGTAIYSYDALGNRTWENLVKGGVTIKNQTASYDALGRLTRWAEAGTATAPAASTAHSYDANGNIRRTHSEYRAIDATGGVAATATVRDYWFAYDNMNRVVVDRGGFLGTAGTGGISGGTLNAYNLVGERVTADARRTQRMTIWQPQQSYNPNTQQWTGGWVTGNYNVKTRETFGYDMAGRLATVHEAVGTVSYSGVLLVYGEPVGPGNARATFTYDLLGRLALQEDYGGGTGISVSGPVYSRSISYNAKSQVTSDEVVSAKQHYGFAAYDLFKSVTTYDYGTGSNYALGSVVAQNAVNTKLASGSSSWTVEPSTLTTTSYAWYDGAVQDLVTHDSNTGSSSNPLYTTDLLLNGFGQLAGADVNDGVAKDVVYTLDENGQIIRRDESRSAAPSEGAPHEIFYRFAGKQMGVVGNNGTTDLTYTVSVIDRSKGRPDVTASNAGLFRDGTKTGASGYADFAMSPTPYNSYDQGSTGGAYTVRAGDTLQGIAATLYGDANLWYKLAEANGMGANGALIEGQVLTLPVGVTRSTHNADTFRPYDPIDALGDLSPTTPKPPKKPKCGVFGQILVAAIAVGVTILTAGSSAPLTAQIGAAVLGSTVSQGFAVVTGIQDRFSFKGVALAALSAGVAGGLDKLGAFGKLGIALESGGSNILNAAARGALSSAVTQGIATATGLQSKFDFAGVAAAGVGAGIGNFVGGKIDGKLGSGFAENLLANTAGGIANAATRSAINGNSFGDNFRAALPDIIGQALGSAAARGATALARAVGESAMANPSEGGVQSIGNAAADEIVVTANLPQRWAGSRTSAMGISLGLYSLEERIDLDVQEGRRSPVQAAQARIMALAYKQSLADAASAGLPMGRTAARVDAEGRPYLITDQSGGFALTQGTLTGWTQGYMARFDAGLNAPDGKAEFLDAIAYNRDLVRQWDAQAYAAIDGSIIGVSRFAASTAIAPLGVADLAYSLYSGETTAQQLLADSAVGIATTLILHKPVGALTAKLGGAETATARAARLGREGEAAAGISGPKVGVTINGRTRFPDEINPSYIKEVKNVARQGWTRQLRDYSDLAMQRGVPFELWVRPDTKISRVLDAAEKRGDVVIRFIGGN